MPDLKNLESRMQETLGKARLCEARPPYCPDIRLQLYDPSCMEGPISHDEAQKIVAEPAYWSFCWASGQVLAKFILSNPHWVRGKTVLDFGSGSGVVAVASALAGAQGVIACDCDTNALEAVNLNAELNGVRIETTDSIDAAHKAVDLIVAADVLYDRDNFPFLDDFEKRANQVLLADSRVKQLPSKNYQLIATEKARTWPDLNEFEEFNTVRIYALRKDG